MPLNDSSSTNLSGYVPFTPSVAQPPTPNSNLQPPRSSTMRCPLPILGQATADSLRSFYLQGNVPQVRFLTPEGVNTTGGTTTTSATSTTSSSGTSGSGTANVALTSSITTPALSNKSCRLSNLEKCKRRLKFSIQQIKQTIVPLSLKYYL